MKLKAFIMFILSIVLLLSFVSCNYLKITKEKPDNNAPLVNTTNDSIAQSEKNNTDFLENSNSTSDAVTSLEYPKGYTGGTKHFNIWTEVYWFETMEEVKPVVSALKENGSVIYCNGAFDCDEKYFDIKVCIYFQRSNITENQDLTSPFDRYIEYVYVKWFAFDHFISIDDLCYVYAEDLAVMYTSTRIGGNIEIKNSELLSIDFGIREYGLEWTDTLPPPAGYTIYYNDVIVGYFAFYNSFNMNTLPNEYVNELAKSFTKFGGIPTPNKSNSFHDLESYCIETREEAL